MVPFFDYSRGFLSIAQVIQDPNVLQSMVWVGIYGVQGLLIGFKFIKGVPATGRYPRKFKGCSIGVQRLGIRVM